MQLTRGEFFLLPFVCKSELVAVVFLLPDLDVGQLYHDSKRTVFEKNIKYPCAKCQLTPHLLSSFDHICCFESDTNSPLNESLCDVNRGNIRYLTYNSEKDLSQVLDLPSERITATSFASPVKHLEGPTEVQLAGGLNRVLPSKQQQTENRPNRQR